MNCPSVWKPWKAEFMLIVSAALLAACGSDSDVPLEEADIRISGSSTVYPISAEASRRFQRSERDARIAVEFTGTTAGFRKLCAREVHMIGASRPINTDELAACEANETRFIEVQIATDALSVVVNGANDWAQSMTVAELGMIWEPTAEGRVTKWSDVRAEWPDEPLVLFGRGQDSGTYDYFTTYIVGMARAIRGDYTASEDEEFLAEGIAAEPNALGFFGLGAYLRHWEELNVVAIDAGDGPYFPTVDNARDGRYQPLSRSLFWYVNAHDAHNVPHLRRFVDDSLAGMRNWVSLTGYIPLAEADYVLARERFAQGVTGGKSR